MLGISQKIVKRLRDEVFAKIQKLPIKYFDTHPHGEIMSLYTNDTDTLRQMISQSVPQLVSSVITVVSVFISMIVLNMPLTIVSLVMILII